MLSSYRLVAVSASYPAMKRRLQPEWQSLGKAQMSHHMPHHEHCFDTASNRSRYWPVLNNSGVQDVTPPALELFPHTTPSVDSVTQLLDNMGATWKAQITLALYDAFPQYRAASYDLAHMFAWECETHQQWQRHRPDKSLHCVEGMSGLGNLYKSCLASGLRAMGLDRTYHPGLYISLTNGFRSWVVLSRFIVPKGCFWFGVECKPWVWICRGHNQHGP